MGLDVSDPLLEKELAKMMDAFKKSQPATTTAETFALVVSCVEMGFRAGWKARKRVQTMEVTNGK